MPKTDRKIKSEPTAPTTDMTRMHMLLMFYRRRLDAFVAEKIARYRETRAAAAKENEPKAQAS